MFMTTLPMLMLGFALSGYPDPPNGFIRESIGDNWTNPVGVVDRFDGHHVVWEREGKVCP
jgi:hypothetical protein